MFLNSLKTEQSEQKLGDSITKRQNKMNYNKQLIKDIEVTWPFYHISIPESMKCFSSEISDAGVQYYDGDESSEGVFWESTEFDGKFVNVGFVCNERFIGGPIKIKLDFFSIDGNPKVPDDFETLIDELTLVKEVLQSGD